MEKGKTRKGLPDFHGKEITGKKGGKTGLKQWGIGENRAK